MVVGSFSTSVDVAIVGGGPAGLAAALEARARDRSVAVVMHGGGSRLARPGADPLLAACLAMEIDLLDGDAVLDGDRQLRIPGNLAVPRLRFRRLVLAPDLVCDGSAASGVMSPWSRDVATATPPAEGPPGTTGAAASILGADPAACAAAAALARLGWTVRLEPGEGGLLPDADDAVRIAVTGMLRGAGVQLLPPDVAAAARGEVEPSPLVVDGRALVPAIAGLGLEETAVAVEHGRLVVDAELRTADPRIFAAGGAVSGPPTEGRWIRQGAAAGRAASGAAEAFDEPLPLHLVPLGDAGFAAWCGRTAAAAEDGPLRVAAASAGPRFTASPPDGGEETPAPAAECRLLIDEHGLIVGASIAAHGCPDAAAELLLAVEMAAEPGDLAGVGRDPGSIAAVAIDLAARAALAIVESGETSAADPPIRAGAVTR